MKLAKNQFNIKINKVNIGTRFYSNSVALGFDEQKQDYYDDWILNLKSIWESQKYITVRKWRYTPYRMAKKSNSAPDAKLYDKLYHARINKNSKADPIIVLTFEDNIAIIEALTNHDNMFLKADKNGFKNSVHLAKLRQFVHNTIFNKP